MHTLTGFGSLEEADTIVATALIKEIQIRNIKIINPNIHGIICVSDVGIYDEIVTIYDNVTFNGTKLSYNPYGTIKINNSKITIEDTSGTSCQEVCEAERVIIGGKTNISSNSSDFSLFAFRSDSVSPSIVFLCKSDVIISTDTRELMMGTNKLNFTILHDTKVHLTTGNGFSSLADFGANNVLIDERLVQTGSFMHI